MYMGKCIGHVLINAMGGKKKPSKSYGAGVRRGAGERAEKAL